jgi:hypothetical protein
MLSSILLLGQLAPAAAADVTEQPEFLKGEASLVYAYDGRFYGLEEDNEDVGGVANRAHGLALRAEMGVWHGVSAYLQFQGNTGQSISYSDPRSMGWNPKEDEGSLLNGLPIEEGVNPVEGSGFEGVWLGVRGSPIHQKRGALASWIVETAIKTPDSSNVINRTGSGEGGLHLRFANVFSTSRGPTHPYVSAAYTRTGPFEVQLDGSAPMEANPSDRIDFTAGAEFDTWSDPANSRHLSLEGRVFFGYSSPAVLPSGLFLADVLPGTENEAVTLGESARFGAGFGAHLVPLPEMKIDIHLDAAWPTPHRIEHPYPISTTLNSKEFVIGLAVSYLYL